jgi:lipid-binding SYLF domain-containing protein
MFLLVDQILIKIKLEMETVMNRILAFLCIALMLVMTGCATTGGNTKSEKQASVLKMKNEVLSDLYKIKPDVKAQIANAPGYAVFSNANIYLIFVSAGGGHGVVKNNRSGKHTFMRMGELGIGLGLGAKDFRGVFVFHSTETMNRFIEEGWAFGGQADAAAKASDKGGAVGGEITVDNITIYQLTESGLALQATIKGTKYWKDDELN